MSGIDVATAPELALQQAVLAALVADPVVAGLLGGRVFDEPPTDPVFPYLFTGRIETRPWGGVDGEGTEHALTLTCVSRFGGSEEARAVVAAARAVLHNAALELPGGWRLVNLRATYGDVFRAADWRSTYGVLRLRAVVE